MAKDRDGSEEQPRLFYDNVNPAPMIQRHLEGKARLYAEQHRANGGHGIHYPSGNSQNYPLDHYQQNLSWKKGPNDNGDTGSGGAKLPRKPKPTAPASPARKSLSEKKG